MDKYFPTLQKSLSDPIDINIDLSNYKIRFEFYIDKYSFDLAHLIDQCLISSLIVMFWIHILIWLDNCICKKHWLSIKTIFSILRLAQNFRPLKIYLRNYVVLSPLE